MPAPAKFESLTAIHANERLKLETDPHDMTMRVMDLFTPLGRGQRGLIVAPPRTGKTTVLHKICMSVHKNHPDVEIIVLLVDERPEEVTDFRMTVGKAAMIVASNNDNPTKRHVQVTEQVLADAKRRVEQQKHVLVLFDSLTRMARAYNNLSRGGRTMSGGLDTNALQGPRSFFGAARNVQEGGSLTIIGTALVDTGSRMDQVIFEEFKGTGNMELYLSRELADRRVFPAFDLMRSGTRKEELLYPEDTVRKIHRLRRMVGDQRPIDAMESLLEALGKTATNEEYLRGMA